MGHGKGKGAVNWSASEVEGEICDSGTDVCLRRIGVRPKVAGYADGRGGGSKEGTLNGQGAPPRRARLIECLEILKGIET